MSYIFEIMNSWVRRLGYWKQLFRSQEHTSQEASKFDRWAVNRESEVGVWNYTHQLRTCHQDSESENIVSTWDLFLYSESETGDWIWSQRLASQHGRGATVWVNTSQLEPIKTVFVGSLVQSKIITVDGVCCKSQSVALDVWTSTRRTILGLKSNMFLSL